MGSHHYRLQPVFILGAIFIVGVFLRFYHLGYRSFYFDEAYQYFVALKPIPLIRDGGHLPLSHYVQHFMMILGHSEFTLRLIPALFGTGTIIVSYYLAKLMFDRKTAAISALFIAVSPMLVYYSQEARPYAQYVFLSLASMLTLLLTLKKPSLARYVIYFFTTLACLYTHVFAILVLVAQNLFMALYWRKTHLHLRPWLKIQVLFFICYIPAIIFIMNAAGERAPVDYSIVKTVAGTLYVFFFGRLLFPVDTNLISIILGACSIGATGLLAFRALWNNKGEATFIYISFAIIFLVILLANFKVLIFNEEDSRYLIFLTPLLLILIARGCSEIQHRSLQYMTTGLIVIVSLAALHPYFFKWDELGKGSFRQASEFIKQEITSESDLILCSEYQTQRVMQYYLQSKPGCLMVSDDPELAETDLPDSRIIFVGLKDQTALDYLRHGASQVNYWDSAPFQQTLLENGFLVTNKASWPGKNRLDAYVFEKTFSASQ